MEEPMKDDDLKRKEEEVIEEIKRLWSIILDQMQLCYYYSPEVFWTNMAKIAVVFSVPILLLYFLIKGVASILYTIFVKIA
jgi:hypothetical protein